MAAYTTIDNPELYFQIKLWTGNDGSNALTFDGSENMQPDFVWLACRTRADNKRLQDSIRGAGKMLPSNSSGVEESLSEFVSFDTDGFTLNTSDAGYNSSSHTYCAWCFKAGTSFTNDASATSVGNTDSSGTASSTAGFSISKYVGAGSSLNIVVKHGLSAVPAVMITRNRDDANSWGVYHHKNTSAPETDYLRLDTTNATTDNAEIWNDTAPTSAVFTAGDHSSSNRAGDDFISYFWNEVQGFSKFGSYVGNGNADGTFVYTGFRPAWIIIKNSSSGSTSWLMYDNKRPGYNEDNAYLLASSTDSEASDKDIDILSNGFKIRINNSENNTSGDTYVYMAFAEQPFVNSSGVPNNAR